MVDAAIVDGATSLMSFFFGVRGRPFVTTELDEDSDLEDDVMKLRSALRPIRSRFPLPVLLAGLALVLLGGSLAAAVLSAEAGDGLAAARERERALLAGDEPGGVRRLHHDAHRAAGGGRQAVALLPSLVDGFLKLGEVGGLAHRSRRGCRGGDGRRNGGTQSPSEAVVQR